MPTQGVKGEIGEGQRLSHRWQRNCYRLPATGSGNVGDTHTDRAGRMERTARWTQVELANTTSAAESESWLYAIEN